MKRAKPNHAATPTPAREMQLANIGQCYDHSGSVAIISHSGMIDVIRAYIRLQRKIQFAIYEYPESTKRDYTPLCALVKAIPLFRHGFT